MRQDKNPYDRLMPVYVEVSKLNEALEGTLMPVGSDLTMCALDIYQSAGDNGVGEHLDNLIPLVARRFKRSGRKGKKTTETKTAIRRKCKSLAGKSSQLTRKRYRLVRKG
jgi:hypothetical protein